MEGKQNMTDYEEHYLQLSKYISKLVLLNEEQMSLVLSFFKPMLLKRNEVLVQAGDYSRYMNFVAKGCIRIYFIRDDGQDTTRYLAFENMTATGFASFITQKPSGEYIQAMEETLALRISRQDFYYLLEIIVPWEKFFRKCLEDAYLVNLDNYQREVTKNAEERYRELLSKNPLVVKRLPNKVVASYLNMSPETLSRVKKNSMGK